MAFEQRDNSGSIFVNDRKDKDSHPDRTGTAMIDGKHYWISGWLKKDRNGKSFMSLSFKPKEDQPRQQQRQAPAPARGSARNADMDDEIPFAPEFR